MRIRYLSAFVVTTVIAWVFFYLIGDYNGYVGDLYGDGRAWVKSRVTPVERVFWSLVIGLLFAFIDTTALWVLGRGRMEGDDKKKA